MLFIVVFVIGLVSAVFGGEKKYNYYYSSNYALKNFDQNKQVKFGQYTNNCTNFVSQSIMAGFSKTTSMTSLFNSRNDYLAYYGDDYAWYYLAKFDKGNTWSQAHSLYLYAKYTDKKDKGPVYKENGPKFRYIDSDTLDEFMEFYTTVKVGDIIFTKIAPKNII